MSVAGVLSGSPTTCGSFSFTVTATDTYGCTGSRACTVAVTDPLAASALASSQVGVEPMTVQFTGSATGGCGLPYTYSWDFGDGSPLSADQNPSHTFTEGTYTVTLSVTAGAQNASTSLVIEVYGINFRTFLDDAGRSRLCVDRITGAYTFMITSGPYSGLTVTGSLLVRNGGTLFMSSTGSPYYVYCSYDPIRKRATAYYYDYVTHIYSQIMDSNTADNPVGCGP